MKTDTDITMDRTASARHGIGAGTTVRITVHTTVIIAHITVTTTDTGVLGAMIHGTTEAVTAITDSTILGTMTLGIMEDTTVDITEATMHGMTHGITTIIIMAGMIHITDMVLHTSAAHILRNEATASAPRPKARVPWQATHQNLLSEHLAAQSEAA